MKVKRQYQAGVLALSILVASLPVAGITAPPLLGAARAPVQTNSLFSVQYQPVPNQPVAVQSPAQINDPNEPFKFGKVDLDLLAQINLLDQRFEKEGLVYHESALDAYLDRVGNTVLADREIEKVNWKFRALRDPAPNAFALPNGSIYVNTGLLALLEDEGQLASVLAHEVTHVTRRHTYRQNRSPRKKILAINILGTIATWNPVGGTAGIVIDVIANVSPFMLALSVFGYSREQEREADVEGLKIYRRRATAE